VRPSVRRPWVCLWRVRSVRSSGGRPRTRRPARDFVRAVSGRACSRFGQYPGRSRPHVPLHPCRYFGTEPAPAHSEDASIEADVTPLQSEHSAFASAECRSDRPSGAVPVLAGLVQDDPRRWPAPRRREQSGRRRTTAPCLPVPGRWSRRPRSAADDRRSTSMRSTCRVTGRWCQAFSCPPALGQVIRPRRPRPPSAARRPAGSRAPRRARRVS
jgi:hypothetical protein